MILKPLDYREFAKKDPALDDPVARRARVMEKLKF